VLAANEAVSSDIVASAHLENYAMKLFSWADKEDRAGKFGKNVVKAFYTAGVLFDVMQVSFGELTPENTHARKYSKWKAAYIHNCLKNGETPIAGPVGDEDDDDVLSAPTDPSLAEEGGAGGWSQPPSQPQPPTYAQPPAPVVAPQPVAPPRPSAAAEAPSNKQLTPEQLMKAQKLCKYASSALDYDDVKTAIKNLNEALDLLMSTQQ
jgi:vacuolar protein sorting-associated protein VTA1